MNEQYTDFQNALAMAIASGIGGEGEMMVTTNLYDWSGSITAGTATTIRLKDYIFDYDIVFILYKLSNGFFYNLCLSTKDLYKINNWMIFNNTFVNQGATAFGLSDINKSRDNLQMTVASWGYGLQQLIITGAKFTGTKAINYSVEEQVIGKWIDGKPLYQKTFTISLTPGKEKTIAHNIPNIAQVVHYEGLFDDSIGFFDYTGYERKLYQVNSSSILYTLGASISGVTNCTITIQYTKTTD